MPMFNLIYCSKNFRKTTGFSWNYYSDKTNSGYSGKPDGQPDNIYQRQKIFYAIKNSESFDYKTKLVDNLPNCNNVVPPDTKIVVPLKNLSNFLFSLDFLMINMEIELILK